MIKNKKIKTATKSIESHFAFGEHWNELPKYAGYEPVQYGSWRKLKELFYTSGRYSNERPLPVNIQKDNEIIMVNIYGFKIPEPPIVAGLGTDATKGRVVLCKIGAAEECVAITW